MPLGQVLARELYVAGVAVGLAAAVAVAPDSVVVAVSTSSELLLPAELLSELMHPERLTDMPRRLSSPSRVKNSRLVICYHLSA